MRDSTLRAAVRGDGGPLADIMIAFLLLDQVWGRRYGPELDGWFS